MTLNKVYRIEEINRRYAILRDDRGIMIELLQSRFRKVEELVPKNGLEKEIDEIFSMGYRE